MGRCHIRMPWSCWKKVMNALQYLCKGLFSTDTVVFRMLKSYAKHTHTSFSDHHTWMGGFHNGTTPRLVPRSLADLPLQWGRPWSRKDRHLTLPSLAAPTLVHLWRQSLMLCLVTSSCSAMLATPARMPRAAWWAAWNFVSLLSIRRWPLGEAWSRNFETRKTYLVGCGWNDDYKLAIIHDLFLRILLLICIIIYINYGTTCVDIYNMYFYMM